MNNFIKANDLHIRNSRSWNEYSNKNQYRNDDGSPVFQCVIFMVLSVLCFKTPKGFSSIPFALQKASNAC